MGQLSDYILYLLLKVFERKKPPLEWDVTGKMREQLKIYQYQLEFEGGERYGPAFNHMDEAINFKLKSTPEQFARGIQIVKFWTYADKEKYRYVEPELVG